MGREAFPSQIPVCGGPRASVPTEKGRCAGKAGFAGGGALGRPGQLRVWVNSASETSVEGPRCPDLGTFGLCSAGRRLGGVAGDGQRTRCAAQAAPRDPPRRPCGTARLHRSLSDCNPGPVTSLNGTLIPHPRTGGSTGCSSQPGVGVTPSTGRGRDLS